MEPPKLPRKQPMMTKPLVFFKQGLIFGFLRSRALVQIWLFENTELRLEGIILGFDEYMNLVLEDAVEICVKRNTRRPLGTIMVKGDNLALIRNA